MAEVRSQRPKVYNLFLFGAPTHEIERDVEQFANVFRQGFAVQLSNANQFTKTNLNQAITTVQNEILDKLRDGHTYFIEDGHGLEAMARVRTLTGYGPYSRARPGNVVLLGHSVDDLQIHVQRNVPSLPLVDDLVVFNDFSDPRLPRTGITFGSEINRRKWFWLNNGTQTMIGRPLEKKIKDDHVERFKSLVQAAFRNSLVGVR